MQTKPMFLRTMHTVMRIALLLCGMALALTRAAATATDTTLNLSNVDSESTASTNADTIQNQLLSYRASDINGTDTHAKLFIPQGTYYINRPIFFNQCYCQIGGQVDANGAPTSVLKASSNYAGALIGWNMHCKFLPLINENRKQLNGTGGAGWLDSSVSDTKYGLVPDPASPKNRATVCFPASPLSAGPMYTTDNGNVHVAGRPSFWERVGTSTNNDNMDQFTIDVMVHKNSATSSEGVICAEGINDAEYAVGGRAYNVWRIHDYGDQTGTGGSDRHLWFEFFTADGLEHNYCNTTRGLDLGPALQSGKTYRISVQADFTTGYMYGWVGVDGAPPVLRGVLRLRSVNGGACGAGNPAIPLRPMCFGSLMVNADNTGSYDIGYANDTGGYDFVLCGLRVSNGLRYRVDGSYGQQGDTSQTYAQDSALVAGTDNRQFFNGGSGTELDNMIACLELGAPVNNVFNNDTTSTLVKVLHGKAADPARSATGVYSYGFMRPGIGNQISVQSEGDHLVDLVLQCNKGWGAGVLFGAGDYNHQIRNVTATGGYWGIGVVVKSENLYPLTIANCTLDGTDAAINAYCAYTNTTNCTITPGRFGLYLHAVEGGADHITIRAPKPYMENVIRIDDINHNGGGIFIGSYISTADAGASSWTRFKSLIRVDAQSCSIDPWLHLYFHDLNFGWTNLPWSNVRDFTGAQQTTALAELCGNYDTAQTGCAWDQGMSRCDFALESVSVAGGTSTTNGPGAVIRDTGRDIWYTTMEAVKVGPYTEQLDYYAPDWRGNITNLWDGSTYIRSPYEQGMIVKYTDGHYYQCAYYTSIIPCDDHANWQQIDQPTCATKPMNLMNLVTSYWDTAAPPPGGGDTRSWWQDAVRWNVENPTTKPWFDCTGSGTGSASTWSAGTGALCASASFSVSALKVDGSLYTAGTTIGGSGTQGCSILLSATVAHTDNFDSYDIFRKIEFYFDGNTSLPAAVAYTNGLPSDGSVGALWMSDGATHTVTLVKAYDSLGKTTTFTPGSGAPIIVKPTVESKSSEYPGREAVKCVDGSGLSAPLNTGDAVPTTWPTHDGNFTNMYLTAGGPPANEWIIFNLGNACTISGFHLWNQAESLARGIQTMTVEADLNGTWTAVAFTPTPVAQSSGANDPGQTYTITVPQTTQRIRFRNYTTWGDNTYVGMAELRFIASSPPSVTLTAPANNAVFTAPATISLTATASANNGGSISKVEFYQGTTLLGTATTSPYAYTWTNVAAGSYTLTAKAYDNTNAATTSSGNNITVNCTPIIVKPTVESKSSEFPGREAVKCVDGSGLSTALNTGDVVPTTWPTHDGNFTNMYLTAGGPPANEWIIFNLGSAYTISGFHLWNQAESLARGIQTMTVEADLGGTWTAVTFTPAQIAQSSGANDPGQTYTFSAAQTTQRIRFRNYTTWGDNTYVGMAELRFIASPPPSATLTAPANNAVFTAPATISLTATASANNGGSISKVEFYQGTTLLGMATTSPYAYTWTNVAAGS